MRAHPSGQISGLAPHPVHQRIDVDVAENLDQVVGIADMRALAVAAADAHQAPLLVQGGKRKDAMSIGTGHGNELGTHA